MRMPCVNGMTDEVDYSLLFNVQCVPIPQKKLIRTSPSAMLPSSGSVYPARCFAAALRASSRSFLLSTDGAPAPAAREVIK